MRNEEHQDLTNLFCLHGNVKKCTFLYVRYIRYIVNSFRNRSAVLYRVWCWIYYNMMLWCLFQPRRFHFGATWALWLTGTNWAHSDLSCFMSISPLGCRHANVCCYLAALSIVWTCYVGLLTVVAIISDCTHPVVCKNICICFFVDNLCILCQNG